MVPGPALGLGGRSEQFDDPGLVANRVEVGVFVRPILEVGSDSEALAEKRQRLGDLSGARVEARQVVSPDRVARGSEEVLDDRSLAQSNTASAAFSFPASS